MSKYSTSICAVASLVFHSSLVVAYEYAPTPPLDPDSGALFAEIVSSNPTSLHLEHAVFGMKEYNFDLSYDQASNSLKIVKQEINSCFDSAPTDQYPEVRFRGMHYQMPPEGFTSAIPWIVAVNHGVGLGSVRVRAFRLYGVDADGNNQLVTDHMICPACDSNNKVWGYNMPKAEWRIPSAWNILPNGSVFGVNNNIVDIPTSNSPDMLFHMWSTDWPRPAARGDWSYFAEAEVLPVGEGMIQIGFDYWDSVTGSIATEGAVSSWVCQDMAHPNRWVTVRTPLKKL